MNRRAWMIGSGIDVWEIVQMAEALDSPEALIEDTLLSASQVRLALAYRAAYPEEIDRFIAENNQPLAGLRVLYPIIEVIEVIEVIEA